jgi:hypothetical protein
VFFFFWSLCCVFFFFWSLCCVFFFFWSLCCVFFFYLQLLVTPLVSSNVSCFRGVKDWRCGRMELLRFARRYNKINNTVNMNNVNSK